MDESSVPVFSRPSTGPAQPAPSLFGPSRALPARPQPTADARPAAASAWQPAHWRLRTRLVVLAALPMIMAVTLATMRVLDAVHDHNDRAAVDAVIFGVLVLISIVIFVVVARSILDHLEHDR